ncbi:hypothetical protein PYCCODRAFT_1272490 [Trametes coccinea BRFM310]|uniref:Uncharacterized protein n=1 Tax=Trametes coccinea (strain BRFM310) TaxID=1353009 RepID=A0A1Y2IXR1_TRAC3|nr:hypothetical protein PYCCODRAFT_1272490 [Trametes coccinea BRFM310]
MLVVLQLAARSSHSSLDPLLVPRSLATPLFRAPFTVFLPLQTKSRDAPSHENAEVASSRPPRLHYTIPGTHASPSPHPPSIRRFVPAPSSAFLASHNTAITRRALHPARYETATASCMRSRGYAREAWCARPRCHGHSKPESRLVPDPIDMRRRHRRRNAEATIFCVLVLTPAAVVSLCLGSSCTI